MESSMTGEEQFITAIIKKAIEDTTYTGVAEYKIKFKMDAIDWIVSLHPEFVNYCKMVALDPEPIRDKIIENVDMSYTQKQKFKIKDEGITL